MVTTVVTSIFLVALVVSAATTIGANITTAGNLTVSGTITGAVKASSTLSVTESVTSSSIFPWANNSSDLGINGIAWRNIYASGTVYGNIVSVGNGTVTSTVIRASGTATSTFSSGIEILESSGTSTLTLGSLRGGVGLGSCIVMGNGVDNAGSLYLFVSATSTGGIFLATSTNSRVCF